jgi:putative FmdB family regulatory protein
MPLYEYTCRKCGHTFEHLTTGGATATATVVACPECASAEVDQVFGLPAQGKVTAGPATNCRGDGPPCGAPWCGRKG